MRYAMLSLTLFCTLAWPGGAQAQESDDATSVAERRTLGEHIFIPSGFIPYAFITTHVHTNTGAGLVLNSKKPFIDLDGDTVGTLEGDIAFMALQFQYQHAFAEWIAARIALSGIARVGTDEQSVLAQGVSAVYGVNLGVSVRLLRTERVMLSGTVALRPRDLITLNLFDFAQSVIDEVGLTEDNNLVDHDKSYNASAGLRFAWSPWVWLGLTALGEIGAGDPLGDEPTDLATTLATTADVDLGMLTSVPIGFLLSFSRNSFSENAGDLAEAVTTFGLGVFYTGREDFSIGIEAQAAKLPERGSEDDLDAVLGTFVLRYYF